MRSKPAIPAAAVNLEFEFHRKQGGESVAIRSCVILTIASFLLTMPAPQRVALGQTGVTGPSDQASMTARELYSAAATEMRALNHRSASLHLQSILKHHPDSELAPTAAFFLGECQLAMQSPKAAFETLSRHPNWPDNLRTAVHDRKLFAARMAAAQQQKSGRTLDSIRWLVVASMLVDNDSKPAIEQQILQAANAELTRTLQDRTAPPKVINDFFQALEVQCEIPRHLIPQLHFATAEQLRKAGKLTDAMTWYSNAEQAVARDTETQSSSRWLKTVALRKCEVLVAQKKYAEAKQCIDTQLEKSQLKPAESLPPELVAYLRLLQVRCQIANIEFKEAFQTLDSIDSIPNCPDNVHAQAGWMRGELHFMQRQYEPAIAAYERVDSLKAEQWQSLALLQKAKCLELLGRNQEAIAAYERVKNEFGSSTGITTAKERLAALPQTTTQTDNSREVTR